MDEPRKESLWRRIHRRYRLSVMNEKTWEEAFHFRLSLVNVITLLTVLFILAIGLLSVLIVYTPIRNVLPGYSESIRQQLIIQSARVDSLGTSLEVQRQYTDVLRQIMSGEVMSDTVQSLDSLEIITREKLLLEAKNEVLVEFMDQYETKERDALQLFDVQQSAPVLTFFRPAQGVITESARPDKHIYGVRIQTPANENATAVLAGTVVLVNYEINNTYTIVLQHDNYLSLYRNVSRCLCHVGDIVRTGQTVAICDNEQPLYFELWQNGQPVNPEEVIVF